ncbi:MAG: hypothetical protein IJC37_01570 [Clostridia bacterium]|nr:hypothetical protein [Clostridia bacterium]
MNFTALTVFVMAKNETDLLRQTVSSIRSNCNDEDLAKITIVPKDEHCASYAVAQELKNADSKVDIHIQQAPNPQICVSELPPLVESSHFVIMVADNEMDARDLSTFIEKAKQHPQRIICAAKWLPESTVIGYGAFHAFCSKTMNRIITLLFNKKVCDPFSIYQIYPIEMYRRLNFDNPETVLYEYTLKPLHAGEEYEEIPTVYESRQNGKTNFNFHILCSVAIRFILTGIKIRFHL